MELILDFAKRLILSKINENSVCVDFTMGNGYDTMFLCTHTKSTVYSFDIQQTALNNTKTLLNENNISNYKLILDSHNNFKKYIQQDIDIGLFNFGYLPNGDKNITTKTNTSLEAVKLALENLSDTGILVLVLYPGHSEGFKEANAIEDFTRHLQGNKYNVIKYDFINKKTPPYVIAIEHR